MSKSALVKIGVSPTQAIGIRKLRQIQQAIDQGNAAHARIDAATMERIRGIAATVGDDAQGDLLATDDQQPAPQVQ